MKNLICAIALMATTICSWSQTVEQTNVSRFSRRQTGYIYENNSIAGYYSYYMLEKVDKKNVAISVDFYDNNLKKATTFEIVRNKKAALLETVYNEKAFMLMSYEKDALTLETFDKGGKSLGSKVFEDLPKWEKYRIAAAMADVEAENTTVFPLGNKGFLRQTFAKNDKIGYVVEAYDNSMKLLWSYGSDPKSDMIESGDIIYSSDKYVGIAVIKKNGKMTKKFDTYFSLVNAVDGTELCHIPLRDTNDGEMSLLNCFIDEPTNDFLLVGEYYKPGDEVLKDNSVGMYLRRIDESGADVTLQKYGWKKEIAKFKQENLSAEDKAEEKGKTYIWFHKFVKSKDGHIYAIGEQYRKQVSALGVAANVLNGGSGSGASNFEIKITNMVVVAFDKDLALVDYQMISKRRSTAMLPEGYGLASPQVLAYYIKARGFFDYQFTSMEPARDRYQIVYTDLNRKDEKGSKADIMVGVIDIEGGKITTKKTPINSEARYVWYAPGKPGSLLIGEYWRKERKFSMHLEKIAE